MHKWARRGADDFVVLAPLWVKKIEEMRAHTEARNGATTQRRNIRQTQRMPLRTTWADCQLSACTDAHLRVRLPLARQRRTLQLRGRLDHCWRRLGLRPAA